MKIKFKPGAYRLGFLKSLPSIVPYSGLFSNQKFLHKCLNINFGGFIFEVSIFQWLYFRYFEIFEKQSCMSYLNATILHNFPLLNNTVIIAVQ